MNAAISLLNQVASYDNKKRKTVANPFTEQYSVNFKKNESKIVRSAQIAGQVNLAARDVWVN